MTRQDFIKQQVEMLNDSFGHSQIRNNVYRRVFSEGIPNIMINALIDQCMELYADIILTWKSLNNLPKEI